MKPRDLLQTLISQKDTRRISVILGPRQVGKTTLLRSLQARLGGPFLDIDVFSQFERVATYERFIETLRLEGYREEADAPFFIYLDEFQRHPELGLVLKNVHDHHPNVKVYATGSSSLAIKDSIQESLAGRKSISHLYPLSFAELLVFKGREDLLAKLRELPRLRTVDHGALVPEALTLLGEFLVWGGYPEVVLTPEKDRLEVLASIFDLYVKKDLVEHLKVEKLRSAKVLIEQLALNNGGTANYSAYGQVSDLDTKTVKSYIEILRETYVLLTVSPFFRNKNREISKAPRVYFIDSGVRNFYCRNFNPVHLRTDAGALFEGFVLGELIKAGEDPEALRYYRAKDGHEVDLVIDRVSSLVPVEIKYKARLKAGDLSGLRRFLETYDASPGYVVSLGELDASGPVKKIDGFNVERLVRGREA